MLLTRESLPPRPLSERPAFHREQRAGLGELDFEKVRNRTVLRKAYAKAPLRLMNPHNHGDAAWVYTSNYGGGILGGDRIHLSVRVRTAAKAALLTQSSTKVYRSSHGACQNLYSEIETAASLVVFPDPVVCYAQSSFSQNQEFHLQDKASLLFVDIISSGRQDFGERWLFKSLKNQIRVYREKKLIFLESLLLEPKIGKLASRMGRFEALGLVLLIGPDFKDHGKQIMDAVGKQSVQPFSELISSANALDQEGALLRFAAVSLEELGKKIRETLHFLPEYLGDNPWARKW